MNVIHKAELNVTQHKSALNKNALIFIICVVFLDPYRETVAIKVVDKKTLNRASTENLLTEIEILKTMKHDHIVELRDFVWDEHYIYLVMEYCSGGDLSKFIKKKKVLPEFVAKYCLQQIASALQFLRENNVSHLDLKPQNILLSSKTSPVLKV